MQVAITTQIIKPQLVKHDEQYIFALFFHELARQTRMHHPSLIDQSEQIPKNQKKAGAVMPRPFIVNGIYQPRKLQLFGFASFLTKSHLLGKF